MIDLLFPDWIWGEFLNSVVEINGIYYFPVEDTVSLIGAFCVTFALYFGAFAFLFFQVIDLIKVILSCLVSWVRCKLTSSKPIAE